MTDFALLKEFPINYHNDGANESREELEENYAEFDLPELTSIEELSESEDYSKSLDEESSSSESDDYSSSEIESDVEHKEVHEHEYVLKRRSVNVQGVLHYYYSSVITSR